MDTLYFLGLVIAAGIGVCIDRWVLRPVTKCDLEAAKDEIITDLEDAKDDIIEAFGERVSKAAVDRLQKALNKLDAQVTDK